MDKNSFPTFPKTNFEFTRYHTRENLLSYKDSFTVSWSGLGFGPDDSMDVFRVYDTEGVRGPHFKGQREHPNETFPDQPYIDTLTVWYDYEDENWWVYFFDGTPNSIFFYARTTDLPSDLLWKEILLTDTDAWYSDLEGDVKWEFFYDPSIPNDTIDGNITVSKTVYKPFDRSVWKNTFRVEIDGEEYLLPPNTNIENKFGFTRGMAVTHRLVGTFNFEITHIYLMYGVPSDIVTLQGQFVSRDPVLRGHYEPQWFLYIYIQDRLENATVYRDNLIYGNGDPLGPLTDKPYFEVNGISVTPINLSIKGE